MFRGHRHQKASSVYVKLLHDRGRHDLLFRIINSAVGIATLIVMICIGMTANRILDQTARASQNLTQEIRASQISPILRLTTTRRVIGEREGEGIIVTLSNIGGGTAKDIIVLVRRGSQFYQTEINKLYQIGTFPLLDFPAVDNIPVNQRTIPILDVFYQAPVHPKEGGGQNFVEPQQTLEFQYGCYKFGEMPTTLSMVFYVSYFDVDDNEYLFISRQVPGFESPGTSIDIDCGIFDTLTALSGNMFWYEDRYYLNPGLRDIGGNFKKQIMKARHVSGDSSSSP